GRETFVLFGASGVIWGVAFYWWYRDDPAKHSAVNRAEMALLADRKPEHAEAAGGAPWRKFLSSGSAWALCIQWFCHYYGFYFYITWLPTYLLQARGLNLKQGALLAGLPI